jgi:hypothetical protein
MVLPTRSVLPGWSCSIALAATANSGGSELDQKPHISNSPAIYLMRAFHGGWGSMGSDPMEYDHIKGPLAAKELETDLHYEALLNSLVSAVLETVAGLLPIDASGISDGAEELVRVTRDEIQGNLSPKGFGTDLNQALVALQKGFLAFARKAAGMPLSEGNYLLLGVAAAQAGGIHRFMNTILSQSFSLQAKAARQSATIHALEALLRDTPMESALVVVGDPFACVKPRILVQPPSSTPYIAGSVSLSATVNSAGMVVFQWYEGLKGDTSKPIPFANSSTYTMPGPLYATTNYWLRVGNSCGTTDSNTATIVVPTQTQNLGNFVPFKSTAALPAENMIFQYLKVSSSAAVMRFGLISRAGQRVTMALYRVDDTFGYLKLQTFTQPTLMTVGAMEIPPVSVCLLSPGTYYIVARFQSPAMIGGLLDGVNSAFAGWSMSFGLPWPDMTAASYIFGLHSLNFYLVVQ